MRITKTRRGRHVSGKEERDSDVTAIVEMSARNSGKHGVSPGRARGVTRKVRGRVP